MQKLSNKTKLTLIKIIHTIVWVIFAVAIFYIIFAGIFDSITLMVWVCIGLIILESIVLIICKWKCPLTLLAQKYTDNKDIGFDIFLPIWLAKHNKTIFSILFFIGLALILWRVFV